MCTEGKAYVPIAEAARLLATTETRVLMMLKRNELPGRHDDDGWHVDQSALKLCGQPKPSDILKPGCGGGCDGCGAH
ncbi:MAG: hypothetical protein CXR31_07100 [Geobacter sp.]|nr:MAG: hypothetical protein CXR31_07100 [Geobacter sp.]